MVPYMSDPVTNVEIEDVLSSIRRLVSTKEREGWSSSSEDKGKGEKLVLTPSLRVTDDSSETSGDVEESVENKPTENRTVDGLIAEDETLGKELCDHAKGESSEQHAISESADEANVQEVPPQEIHHQEHEGADQMDAQSADDEYQAEPDNTENVIENDDEEFRLKISEIVEDSDDTYSEAVKVGGVADEEVGGESTSFLEARAAQFEAAVAERRDQWEPDGSSDHENAAGPVEPLPWDDNEEIQGEQHPAELVDDAPTSPDRAVFGIQARQRSDADENEFLIEDESLSVDEAFLDEAALRDMVSEIVRQELQGALGERITRNVRKLVRREIHRALASQELD